MTIKKISKKPDTIKKRKGYKIPLLGGDALKNAAGELGKKMPINPNIIIKADNLPDPTTLLGMYHEGEEVPELSQEDWGGKYVGDKLNARQEMFCKLYVSKEFFGNGVQTYIEVYNPDQTQKNWYKTACAVSSEILSNPKVCNRINDLLSADGLNDSFVDKQLLFLVTQHEEKGAKLGAIKEYNALKQRITKKLDVTSAGYSFASNLDAE